VVIAVDPGLIKAQSHAIAENVRHSLFHQFPTLSEVLVHVGPWSEEREGFHELTDIHEQVPELLGG
jgi:divalent metal cation (Fe/Co/Zn/Cd) transporter